MVRSFWLSAVLALVLCVGCGSGSNVNLPGNAKPGWTSDNVKSLLCDPSQNGCQCFINAVTVKYTPDQVTAAKNNNNSDPTVTAVYNDLMSIFTTCTSNGTGGQNPATPGTTGAPGTSGVPTFPSSNGAPGMPSFPSDGTPTFPGGSTFFPASNGSSTSLTYNFSDGSCSTGAHTFASLAQECSGLQSASLNNGAACALFTRMTTFTGLGCPGSFTSMP